MKTILKICVLIYTIWIISGCKQISQENKAPDFQFDSTHTVISDTSQLKWIVRDLNSLWIPNTNDLNMTESILKSAIKENINEYWSLLDTVTFKKYYRQYTFYTTSNNDSIIFINAFCRVMSIPVDSAGTWIQRPYDWKNTFMMVNDGGDCFWSIKINLSRKAYFDFMVNGEA
jgi:hypothetical protein